MPPSWTRSPASLKSTDFCGLGREMRTRNPPIVTSQIVQCVAFKNESAVTQTVVFTVFVTDRC